MGLSKQGKSLITNDILGNELTENDTTEDLDCHPANGEKYSPLNNGEDSNFNQDQFHFFEVGDLILVDVPSNDSKKGIAKLCNSVNLVKLLKNCKSVKLMVVLKASNWSGRNEQIRNTISYYEKFVRSSHNDQIQQLRKRSLLLFNITPDSQPLNQLKNIIAQVQGEDYKVRDYKTAFIKPLTLKRKKKEEKKEEYKETNVQHLMEVVKELDFVQNPVKVFSFQIDQKDSKFINKLEQIIQNQLKDLIGKKEFKAVNDQISSIEEMEAFENAFIHSFIQQVKEIVIKHLNDEMS